MKLVYFVQYYFPEKAAGLQLVKDLLEGFVRGGFDVKLFTPTPTRGVTEEERKESKKNESLYNEKLTIHRMALYREGKGFIPRAFRYIIFSLECFMKGLTEPCEVIFTGSGPPSQGVICGLVRKLTKKKFIYNLQDIFPDSLINGGITSEGSLIWKIGRRMENFTYKNADAIIVISDDFKANIMAKGVPEEKIVVVPNWVNTSINPIPRANNKLIKKYNLDPSKFYVCYSGNIGYTQNIELLVTVAERIKNTLPDVAFVVIGDGSAREELGKLVEGKRLTNVILLPYQPYEDLSHVFSLGDVGLVISKSGVGENSIPSKTWDIMAAEKPVLASFDVNSELSKIIQKIGCGVAVPADNAEELIEAIKKLRESQEFRIQCGIKGKTYLLEHLSRDKCVKKYVDTAHAVLTGEGKENDR